MSTDETASDSAFRTRAVHAGWDSDPQTGAVTVPIYQSSTFARDGVHGYRNGWDYARAGNPTRAALERRMADLECGTAAFATSSGVSAGNLVVQMFCEPGARVIVPTSAYSGTWTLFSGIYRRWGLEPEAVDLADLAAVEAVLRRGDVKLVWIESPANPTLELCDIAAVSQLAHEHRALVCVDNTFATPYLQRPLELGADFVVDSTTKFLGGHSDVIGGVVVTRDLELADALEIGQCAIGSVPSPMDCYLVLRGIATLPVRMEAISRSALKIARFLEGHPRVLRVNYPGLESHPQHELARRQMAAGGGMVSFLVDGTIDDAAEFVSRARVFTLAVSLGGVESLIEHAATMTHSSTSNTPLQVEDNLVRLSIGLEDTDELIADLSAAFEGMA